MKDKTSQQRGGRLTAEQAECAHRSKRPIETLQAMVQRRMLHTFANSALALAVLAGCSDGQSPKPPPRVPKPKVEREAVDPIHQAPAQDRRITQV